MRWRYGSSPSGGREAREEGDRIIQRTPEEIDREREAGLHEAYYQLANIVFQVSERVTGHKLDREKHEHIIYDAVDEALGNFLTIPSLCNGNLR